MSKDVKKKSIKIFATLSMEEEKKKKNIITIKNSMNFTD